MQKFGVFVFFSVVVLFFFWFFDFVFNLLSVAGIGAMGGEI